MSTKRTYQPSSKKRAKKLGFMSKMKTKQSRRVLSNKRQKGRKNISSL